MAPVLVASLPRSLATCVRYGPKHAPKCWRVNALGIRFKSTPAAASLVEENGRVATSHDDNRDTLDLTFCDYENAFKSKTTWEVLRALLVFQMCGIRPLVENNEKGEDGSKMSNIQKITLLTSDPKSGPKTTSKKWDKCRILYK
ncbi:hypothetical protein SK128_009755 [Halocaridina rubra]|uniref:Uncharacterized protein n=1 Tax=Halocaridina rubra TaxID=373956 RepID=A0AAN8WRY4_HALRR